MLNVVWVSMVLAALVCGALTGRMDAVAKATTTSAGAAVDLAIGLVGVMAFWIGAMKALQQAGVLAWLARRLAPVMCWLFPDVPPDHPAMSMMIMNITSNMLGLANAATPFGLKAMIELDKLNREKGTATNAMALFLAINTSNLAILPTGMIALRASIGSEAPGAILVPTLLATSCSTLIAILVSKALCNLAAFAPPKVAPAEIDDPQHKAEEIDTSEAEETIGRIPPVVQGWRLHVVLGSLVVVLLALGYAFFEMVAGTPAAASGMKEALGATPVMAVGWSGALKTLSAQWPLPLLIGLISFLAIFRSVKIYDALVEGGKEGFQVALRIIPYLVAILVAVGMLRASGAIDLMVALLEPMTSAIGMPAEALPMALLRSLSGSGAFAVSSEIMQTHGPDSLIGMIVSTMQGSTETTFYVLALYFGVVGIKRVRHTLVACLCADAAGVIATCWAVRLVLF